MTPTIISMLVFLGVTTVIGLLAFVFREQGPQTAAPSTCWSANASRKDQQTNDILRKTAFENDKKSPAQRRWRRNSSPLKSSSSRPTATSSPRPDGHRPAAGRPAAQAHTLLAKLLPILAGPDQRPRADDATVPVAVPEAGQALQEVHRRNSPTGLELVARHLRSGQSLGGGDARRRRGDARADRHGVRPRLRGAEPRHPYRGVA